MNDKKDKNIILELFDTRIGKLISLDYFKFLYAFSVFLVIFFTSFGEFYVARYLSFSIIVKILLFFVILIVSLLVLLFTRIIYEAYIALFYIESHLREIKNKK